MEEFIGIKMPPHRSVREQLKSLILNDDTVEVPAPDNPAPRKGVITVVHEESGWVG